MVKLLFVIGLEAFSILAAECGQSDYRIVVDKHELLWYNKDYIENPLTSIFWYNDTVQALNASYKILEDLGSNIEKTMDVYILHDTGNQKMWSLHNANVCYMLESNFLNVQDIFNYGNVTKCPIKKGYYVIKNAVYDQSKLPVGVPRGKFLVDCDVYKGAVHLSQQRTYFTVEDLPKTMA